MDQENAINFKLGELSAHTSEIHQQLGMLHNVCTGIDGRLRLVEGHVKELSVKIALIGIFSGGVGSFLMSLVLKHI